MNYINRNHFTELDPATANEIRAMFGDALVLTGPDKAD